MYSVFIPDNYSTSTKYPLIMYLHGVGDRGNDYAPKTGPDMQQLASKQSQQLYPCIVYAPQCPENDQWVNVPEWISCPYSTNAIPESNANKDALRGLDTICVKYSVDTNRIILSGGSMGGYGTWDILCRHPVNKFAAAVPIAGGGDTSKAAGFANRIPVWAFHGTNDGVVPVEGSLTMMQAIQRAGGSPPSKLTEFSESEIGSNGYQSYGEHIYFMPFPIEPGLLPWIFSQSKGTTRIGGERREAHASAGPRETRIVLRLSDAKSSGLRIHVSKNGAAGPKVFDLQGQALVRQTQ